jgi:hypothetical protein
LRKNILYNQKIIYVIILAVKVLRALRAFRTLKTIWLIRGAQVILNSIIRAQMKSVTTVGVVIVVFLSIFSILTFNQIYADNTANNEQVANSWGCFLACFCSLFMIITVG